MKKIISSSIIYMATIFPVYASQNVDIDNDGLIEIHSVEELDLVRHDSYGMSLNGNSTGCPNDSCIGYELANDIDFDTNHNGIFDEQDIFWNDGLGWLPIPSLSSTLDGNGYTIKNLNIKRPEMDYSGLISITNNTKIRNINFYNANINGKKYTSIISAKSYQSSFDNITIRGSTIGGYDYVGSITGQANGNRTKLSNIYIQASISGSYTTGGLSGSVIGDEYLPREQNPIIRNIIADIEVVSTVTTGGLVAGIGYSTIENIRVQGNVHGSTYTGGLFASIGNSHLHDASFIGKIEGTTAAGIAASMHNTSASQIFSNAEIVGASLPSAGLIGTLSDSMLSDSYTLGTINAPAFSIAGVIGTAKGNSSVYRTYSAITINPGHSGTAYGFTGPLYSTNTTLTVEDSYWDYQTAGTTNSLPGYALSVRTNELQCPTSPNDNLCSSQLFVNWDPLIWNFRSSIEYPILTPAP